MSSVTHHDETISAAGPDYWRSLDEQSNSPEFRAWLDHEFPVLAGKLQQAERRGPVSRRHFLQLMAASLALAGSTGAGGCRRPVSNILPYNQKPEDLIPGRPLYYATTQVLAGKPLGVLVETHEGRPTKIEGNPQHPSSLGATDAWAQASVLQLYDPDRSGLIVHDGRPSTWDELLTLLDRQASTFKAARGEGLAILAEVDNSPAMDLLRQQLASALPEATWHVDDLTATLQRQPRLQLDQADVIVSLDCDLLNVEDVGVAYRRAVAAGRRVAVPGDAMNRLYVVEPCPTVTGMAADHRLRLPLSQMYSYALALAHALGVKDLPDTGPRTWDARWTDAVAKDLNAHAGRSAVAAGHRLPPHVHEVVRRMNQQLGNIGKTVLASSPVSAAESFAALVDRLKRGQVQTLLVLGTNPVYSAPADIEVADLIKQAKISIHLGMYRDETAQVCQWHVPQAHPLESWGDVRWGATLAPLQPMIQPLLGGKTALEMVARLVGYATSDPYEIVRQSFASATGDEGTERRFRDFLHRGVAQVPEKGTGVFFGPTANQLDASSTEKDPRPLFPFELPPVTPATSQEGQEGFEVAFALDASVYDGRFANNGWLQECPDPLTKLTWDNAAIVSPGTARRLSVATGDVVKIDVAGRSIEIPVFVLPSCADSVLTLPLGYGRKHAGVLAAHAGVDVTPLRTTKGTYWAAGALVSKTGRRVRLATTQQHWSIRDHDTVAAQLKKRGIVREISHQQFQQHPDIVRQMDIHVPTTESIYEVPTFEDRQQWAMSIDLTKCIGCSACVISCQSENNVPIVGRDEVIRGREMHWMRIDRYFAGSDPEGDVTLVSQPMMCQHCEIAPCEQVCPVNATVHDEEGLNVMVYNRCIGTRYCSNNCPYKVRRFNFFDYNKGTLRQSGDAPFDRDPEPDPLAGLSAPQIFQPEMDERVKMQKNPDVTVRMRGVMEKCTFCVQRITQARIDQKVSAGQTAEATDVPDGKIRTACQQVCPTEAIVFGDSSDEASRVAALSTNLRAYRVVEHVGTRPRAWYLARLRNINPDMPPVFQPTATVHHHAHAPGHDAGNHDGQHASEAAEHHEENPH